MLEDMDIIEYGLKYIKDNNIETSRKERQMFIKEHGKNAEVLKELGLVNSNLFLKEDIT